MKSRPYWAQLLLSNFRQRLIILKWVYASTLHLVYMDYAGSLFSQFLGTNSAQVHISTFTIGNLSKFSNSDRAEKTKQTKKTRTISRIKPFVDYSAKFPSLLLEFNVTVC